MKKVKKTNKPVGKHPSRKPIWSSQPPACIRNRGVSKPKKSNRPTSSHKMITRSRKDQFRLLDLPAELRANIYSLAFSYPEQPPSLSNIQLPQLLSVSRVVRREALPIYFAANTFTAAVKSNWCVFNSHWHGPGFVRFKGSGTVEMSPLLVSQEIGLPDEAVRLQHIDFSVKCVCCSDSRQIASVTVRVANRKTVVESTVTSKQLVTKENLKLVFAEVEKVAKRIGDRNVFNGLTTGDVVELATCFRYDQND